MIHKILISSICAISLSANSIINIPEELSKISLIEDPVENASRIFHILDSSFIKKENLNGKDVVFKNGKMIGACIKSNQVNNSSNIYIPDELKNIYMIYQDFDTENGTYSYDEETFNVDNGNFKKAVEAGNRTELILYTSSLNNFNKSSKNGEPFKCSSNGEEYPLHSWKPEWKKISRTVYVDKKDVMSQNNHFVYTVDKFHAILSDYISNTWYKSNPMNFIYYPVLTENILSAEIPTNIEDYNPFSLTPYVQKYEKPILGKPESSYVEDTKMIGKEIKTSSDEIWAIGQGYQTNLGNMVKHLLTHVGTEPVNTSFLNPDLVNIDYQVRRSYETDDTSEALNELIQNLASREMLNANVNKSINADTIIYPYCYWMNYEALNTSKSKIFSLEEENSEYPTKGVNPNKFIPFDYIKFSSRYTPTKTDYEMLGTGDVGGVSPEKLLMKKAFSTLIDMDTHKLKPGVKSELRDDAGFINCILNQTTNFYNEGNRDISEISDFTANSITSTISSILSTDITAKKLLKRVKNSGSNIWKENSEIYNWLKIYQKSFYNNLNEGVFDKKKDFVETKLELEKGTITSQSQLAGRIVEMIKKDIRASREFKISKFTETLDSLNHLMNNDTPDSEQMINNIEKQQNILTIQEVLDANKYLMENGSPARFGAVSENDLITKLYKIKNNVLKEKVFAYNESNIITPLDVDFDDDGGFTKNQLFNGRMGMSLAFDDGEMYTKMATKSFGGAMSCTNYSPCALNQVAIRKDGTPSISLIGKTAYGSIFKKTINSKNNSTEDSIFVMNSYIDGSGNIKPFIGEFNLDNGKSEKKFYLIYFFKKDYDGQSEIIYSVKPYGINMNLSNEETTSGFPMNSEILKDFFDLDFKKENNQMYRFKFGFDGKYNFNNEGVLSEHTLSGKANSGDIGSTRFPIFGINEAYNNIEAKNITNETLYTMLRFIPNSKEKSTYGDYLNENKFYESKYFKMAKNNFITIYHMGLRVVNNLTGASRIINGTRDTDSDFLSDMNHLFIDWKYKSIPNNQFKIFKFNDKGIVYSDGISHEILTSEDDVFTAEKVPGIGINAYQIGGFDIYGAREDKTVFKYPSALYRGRFMLNPTPANVDNEFGSMYWKNGSSRGIPYKLYRQPTFNLSFGETVSTCNTGIPVFYQNIIESVFDINDENGGCGEGFERVGYICRKEELKEASIIAMGDKCIAYYQKDFRIKEDIDCGLGEYDPIIGSCYLEAQISNESTCPIGYVDGEELGKPGECLKEMKILTDEMYDTMICENGISNEEDATFTDIEEQSYDTATCLNSTYTYADVLSQNGAHLKGCFKDRRKNIGSGCRTQNGNLFNGKFLKRNSDTGNLSHSWCWGGAKLEIKNGDNVHMTCPSFGATPRKELVVDLDNGNLNIGHIFATELGYDDVPNISGQVSCNNYGNNDNFEDFMLCGVDGEFLKEYGVCQSPHSPVYNTCPDGKTRFYDNVENKWMCGIATCSSDDYILNSTKCTKCN